MPADQIKRAKTFEAFLKYAAAYGKLVHLYETARIDEVRGDDGRKQLVPRTSFRLVAALTAHRVTLVYEEHYVNRGRGFEDAAGQIVRPQELKLRGVRLRTALEEKGLEVKVVKGQAPP